MSFFFRIIGSLVVLIAFDISGGTLSDPKAIFGINNTTVFSSDIRYHAASALRAADADCAIIGTSMMSNTSPQLLEKKYGIRCINVSMLGASLYERILVLTYALKFEKYKTVILSVDYFGDYAQPNPAVDLDSYNFLYDDSKINDLKLYVGFQWVAPTVRNLVGTAREAASQNVWQRFHDAVRWDSDREMLRFGGLENWIIDEFDSSSKNAVGSLITQINACEDLGAHSPVRITMSKDSQERLIRALSDLMVANKNVRFIGIIPPYSILKRALDLNCEPHKHNKFMSEINGLMELSVDSSNFTLHGFDNENFVTSLNNYKDTRHYSPNISDQIVESALQGRNQINKRNISDYEAGIKRNVNDLNLGKVKLILEKIYK